MYNCLLSKFVPGYFRYMSFLRCRQAAESHVVSIKTVALWNCVIMYMYLFTVWLSDKTCEAAGKCDEPDGCFHSRGVLVFGPDLPGRGKMVSCVYSHYSLCWFQEWSLGFPGGVRSFVLLEVEGTLHARLWDERRFRERELVSEQVGALNPVNHKGLHQGWGKLSWRDM